MTSLGRLTVDDAVERVQTRIDADPGLSTRTLWEGAYRDLMRLEPGGPSACANRLLQAGYRHYKSAPPDGTWWPSRRRCAELLSAAQSSGSTADAELRERLARGLWLP